MLPENGFIKEAIVQKVYYYVPGYEDDISKIIVSQSSKSFLHTQPYHKQVLLLCLALPHWRRTAY